MSQLQVTVRAIAWGGKFIGSHVGYAWVEIYAPGRAELVAAGLTDHGLVPGTDGSGITQNIMRQAYFWGQPIDPAQATEFRAALTVNEPTLLTIVARAPAQAELRASAVEVRCQRWAVPGVDLIGPMAIDMVIPGLITQITSPPAGIVARIGQALPLRAFVRMMCGCQIDNNYWPADNYNINAAISCNGKILGARRLTYNGTPSTFTGTWPLEIAGPYAMDVNAQESTNGNIGWARITFVVIG